MDKDSLAQIYAADLLAKNDPSAAAEAMFEMMERSIAEDSEKDQEVVKDFIILIVKIIKDIDSEYADEMTYLYFERTLKEYIP
tara:strand:- start:1546 stop:1794 length:249 start_codon:yes stop_codon:yes gene_type:complete